MGGRLFGALCVALCTATAAGAGPMDLSTSAIIEVQKLTPDLLNRELTNPLTSFTLLTVQDDFSLLSGDLPGIDDEWANVLQFSPTVPIDLRWKDLYVVNQLVFPVVTIQEPHVNPVPGSAGQFDFTYSETTGFGDILMTNFLAHTSPGGAVFGLGPTFSFPTASDDVAGIGTGKYQMGPAALVGYLPMTGSVWTYASVQHFWSIGGDSDRPDTSLTAIQYSYQFNLNGPSAAGFWAIGASPLITANWEMDGGDEWSVPIGTGVLYTGLIGGVVPARVGFEVDYYVVSPDTVGREWNFRFFFSPMLPINLQRAVVEAF